MGALYAVKAEPRNTVCSPARVNQYRRLRDLERTARALDELIVLTQDIERMGELQAQRQVTQLKIDAARECLL